MSEGSDTKMIQSLIVWTILLSFKAALGSQEEKVVAEHLYDDTQLNTIQHLLELLSSANQNVQLRLDMLDRHLTEISNDINKKITAETHTKLGYDRSKISAYPVSCLNLPEGHQLLQIDSFSPKPFFVWCDNATHGGGWTVIQRRVDGSVNFFRNWKDYKKGFGNLAGEFFIGLDKLHALTTTSVNELLIVMRDRQQNERWAKYDAFSIDNEEEYYALNIMGKYSGDAGDDLSNRQSMRFYTTDKDSPGLCAGIYTHAWWQKGPPCLSSLNGRR